MEQFVHESVSRAALADFARRAEAVGVQLHALEIYEDDALLVRWAVAPYRCDDKREMYSLSKSFTSTAVGVAYGMGRLSPDDLVLDHFPEYAALRTQDARWQRLRVGHVLSMNTGHAACVMPAVAFAEDGVRAFFEQPLAHEPGSFFAYNTAATFLAAELVRRTTGRTVPELLAREVFPALGIEDFSWERCADGRCQGGTGLCVSCDDAAKLGLLYLHEGEWQGRQILPRAWVQMACRAHSDNSGNGTPDWCAGYGYQFWMNRDGGYRGDGAFGQLCVILPKSRRVVAVTAECSNMCDELDAIWALLARLHEPDADPAAPGLPALYAPHGALDGRCRDTGWLELAPNPTGFTAVRVRTEETAVRLYFCDEAGVQCVRAPSGAWRENVLCAPYLRPALGRQMPRGRRAPLRFAAAAHSEADALALECRGLNTPHAFTLRVSDTQEGGLRLELLSPMEVFGAEKLLLAQPARQ